MHHSSHGIRSKGGQIETHNTRTGNQEYDKMEEQNKKICKRRKNNGEGNTSHMHRRPHLFVFVAEKKGGPQSPHLFVSVSWLKVSMQLNDVSCRPITYQDLR